MGVKKTDTLMMIKLTRPYKAYKGICSLPERVAKAKVKQGAARLVSLDEAINNALQQEPGLDVEALVEHFGSGRFVWPAEVVGKAASSVLTKQNQGLDEDGKPKTKPAKDSQPDPSQETKTDEEASGEVVSDEEDLEALRDRLKALAKEAGIGHYWNMSIETLKEKLTEAGISY